MDFKELHSPVDPNKPLDQLTPEEKLRMEHQKMHEEHQGHESMHAEMALVFIFTCLLAQILLVQWKIKHYKSYSIATMLGMWLIPTIFCIKNQWYRFIVIWIFFTIVTAIIVRKATKKPIGRTTPRLVYKWFLLIYTLSYIFGILGYIIMMASLFGLNYVFNHKPQDWLDVGVLFIFYGLYYGVLGRDFAEISSDKMASHIGYYTDSGLPSRKLEAGVCAVCGNKLLVSDSEEGLIENTYKLSCSHEFHEFCIRGWCIVGKKQICPYCKEKVDLKMLFKNPWEKPHVLYGQLLDWLRWLLAWQPLILFLVQGINWILGLK